MAGFLLGRGIKRRRVRHAQSGPVNVWPKLLAPHHLTSRPGFALDDWAMLGLDLSFRVLVLTHGAFGDVQQARKSRGGTDDSGGFVYGVFEGGIHGT